MQCREGAVRAGDPAARSANGSHDEFERFVGTLATGELFAAPASAAIFEERRERSTSVAGEEQTNDVAHNPNTS